MSNIKVNRKWISDKPKIESHGMGLCVNAVCQISRGTEKLLRKFSTIDHLCRKFN
jgi:hypothetical protein